LLSNKSVKVPVIRIVLKDLVLDLNQNKAYLIA